MKIFSTSAIVVLLCALSFAQDAPPSAPTPSTTFHLSAQAIALPGNKETVAGTVVGGTFAVTPNFSLRQDNILSGDFNGYFGGFQYALPALAKKLNGVSVFDANTFQFYLTASAGIDHIAKNGGDVQHYAFLAGGGINYDPSGKGKFALNLVEVRYAKLPGFANSTAIVSSGLKLGF